MTGSRLAALLDQATPGPWRYGYEDGSGKVEDKWPESGGAVVAPDDEPLVRSGRDDWGIPYGVEREADARLIALAPDMARLLVDTFAEHWEDIDPELRSRFAALDEKAGAA